MLDDRCDAPAVVGGPGERTGRGACGAQGFIRAVLPGGKDLVFCAHHGREQELALAAAGAAIHDETGKINASPPPASPSSHPDTDHPRAGTASRREPLPSPTGRT